MGNDADRYRRYLDGDDNGLIEIIEIYHEGLTLYLNSNLPCRRANAGYFFAIGCKKASVQWKAIFQNVAV